jgi:hypothetical protein
VNFSVASARYSTDNQVVAKPPPLTSSSARGLSPHAVHTPNTPSYKPKRDAEVNRLVRAGRKAFGDRWFLSPDKRLAAVSIRNDKKDRTHWNIWLLQLDTNVLRV